MFSLSVPPHSRRESGSALLCSALLSWLICSPHIQGQFYYAAQVRFRGHLPSAAAGEGQRQLSYSHDPHWGQLSHSLQVVRAKERRWLPCWCQHITDKRQAGPALPHSCLWAGSPATPTSRASSSIMMSRQGAGPILLRAAAGEGQSQFSCIMTPGPGLLLALGGKGEGERVYLSLI